MVTPGPRYIGAVRIPAASTLKRYGLTEEDWTARLERQGGVCAVCKRPPSNGTLHIDHEHKTGWKKMLPILRRNYVRGLACWHCNSVWLRRGATPEKLRAAADYLEAYATSRSTD